ncbi:MAG: hypothetical protein CMM56_07205 [Rhodospirillaceae bacterium]|nr:hypothetical protein [Rhodospirillaceae bacterium]|tara:strand:- start:14105 stop:15343 length:1239 start_codon:yes stop_codon:yes gene_type:complete
MYKFVKPFSALRPHTQYASSVIAPPYDVVSEDEARTILDASPNSFLGVSRPEAGIPKGVHSDSNKIHTEAKKNLQKLITQKLLVRDEKPAYYIYKMKMGQHEQTGIALTVSVDSYNDNQVKKHELTRPLKEDDRTQNMLSLNTQTGPVLTVNRANSKLKDLLASAKKTSPLLEVKGQHDVIHTIWKVDNLSMVEAITTSFEEMHCIYIADGHHRSAAAARVSGELRTSSSCATDSFNYFLTVVFPHDEMKIFDYNRVVTDLNGLSINTMLSILSDEFDIKPTAKPIKPNRPGVFGMCIANQWYELTMHSELFPMDDPVASLDVSLLQDRILSPILGVGDPRTDPRLDFVGGIRGLEELERLVFSKQYAAAFSLYPTSMEQLMSVADAGKLMPPKSTWFEPKLADGLLSHVLD